MRGAAPGGSAEDSGLQRRRARPVPGEDRQAAGVRTTRPACSGAASEQRGPRAGLREERGPPLGPPSPFSPCGANASISPTGPSRTVGVTVPFAPPALSHRAPSSLEDWQ